MTVQELDVSLFGAPGLGGTRAKVLLVSGDGAVDFLKKQKRYCTASDAEAVCISWREGNDAYVRCHKNGRPITFCGHGLLATAWAWRHIGRQAKRLSTDAARFDINEDSQGKLWLHCPPVPISEPVHLVSDAVDFGFSRPPTGSALAGGDNGYRILCWPDGFDIGLLRADFEVISARSDRAIIATSRADPDADYDVQLRYFAPQFGNPEDSVTGSACVVLADFWRQPELTLVQRSARGGRVCVRRLPDRVALGGEVKINRVSTL